MHMIVPGVRERRTVDRDLTDFFRRYGTARFRRARLQLTNGNHAHFGLVCELLLAPIK